MLTWTLVTVLTLWLVVSAVAQVRLPLPLRVRRYDWLGLLPRWNFFAPHPIVGDVVVQLRLGRGATQWFPLSGPERCARDVLWPAYRRSRKALTDSANQTLAVYRRHPDEPGDVALSIPYLLLLGHATRAARELGGQAVQFRLVHLTHEPEGAQQRVVFTSAVHSLRAVRATVP